jgi:hypothetical protein
MYNARHLDPVERGVHPVVGDLAHARVEPQGQEDPREQQNDEAVQRDLAEHERPVVREDLAQVLLGQAGQAEAFVEPPDRAGSGISARRGGGRAGR